MPHWDAQHQCVRCHQSRATILGTRIPAKRFCRPGETASAVVVLASDESGFAVASELIVDGGLGFDSRLKDAMEAARMHRFGPPEVIVIDDLPRLRVRF